jgi:hypothetical protein
MEDIDSLIEEMGYWPSRSAFVREACIQKIYFEKGKLKGSGEAALGDKEILAG